MVAGDMVTVDMGIVVAEGIAAAVGENGGCCDRENSTTLSIFLRSRDVVGIRHGDSYSIDLVVNSESDGTARKVKVFLRVVGKED